MMTNLFSTFDPATSMKLSMNWISSLTCFMVMPLYFWNMPNRMNMVFMMITTKLHEEFKTLMGKNSKGMTLMMVSLFMFILINNFLGLLPYIFTSSSHLAFSLTMALPMWLSLMLFGWINKTNYMFAHLIPSGTPAMLMPFMVLIETISNIMRPGSLAVRLTANMIAGHLMMSLLGNNSINSSMLIIIFLVQMGLMLFESAVALIQAYVFSVLSTLYSSEIM
uniref:ATP synthase F0 subunit 6 n=1 Tax=Macropes dentipes TaxID=2867886 RepID=UPI002176978A|nr:ATP synthase F0 subunit 6 [Macropes dentipes]YP_010463296.1 ATP synthase F0 subunit 6 [Macropes robustus]UUJ37807.1 ATP synthase F0 subunit 6 [Macropes dentipes]UUJ37820.1 ATP synthase F0 subunit 6 [Macropes robustus]